MKSSSSFINFQLSVNLSWLGRLLTQYCLILSNQRLSAPVKSNTSPHTCHDCHQISLAVLYPTLITMQISSNYVFNRHTLSFFTMTNINRSIKLPVACRMHQQPSSRDLSPTKRIKSYNPLPILNPNNYYNIQERKSILLSVESESTCWCGNTAASTMHMLP